MSITLLDTLHNGSIPRSISPYLTTSELEESIARISTSSHDYEVGKIHTLNNSLQQQDSAFHECNPGPESCCSSFVSIDSTNLDLRPPSPAMEATDDLIESIAAGEANIESSTPLNAGRPRGGSTNEDLSPVSPPNSAMMFENDSNGSTVSASNDLTASGTQTAVEDVYRLDVPIVGYEVMEERAKFTVYKLQVCMNETDWFIFRRYTDFVRLNDRLKRLFPNLTLALPPKAWLRNNYDYRFLEERMQGLQGFVNNIVSHREICNSEIVREFLCLDDPPGCHDSLEESRALAESLEEQVYNLRKMLDERDRNIALLEEELELQKMETENLKRALSLDKGTPKKRRHSNNSASLLAEDDRESYTEADQALQQSLAGSSPGVDFTVDVHVPSGITEGIAELSIHHTTDGASSKTLPANPEIGAGDHCESLPKDDSKISSDRHSVHSDCSGNSDSIQVIPAES